MDPIIKTARISQSSFALDLHRPKTGQALHTTTDKKRANPSQTFTSPTNENSQHSSATHESILNESSINKLVHKNPPAETAQEKAEPQSRALEKTEIQDAFAKAKQEGYLAGMASAKEKNQEQLKTALKQIADLMHSLKDIHESLYQELEDSAVEVVFEAVAKIIGHAATDKDMVYNITREAIERVKGRNKIIIRVSTHDYDMIKTALSHAENSDLHNSNFTVVADNLVQLGGCLIETEAGSLDARLEIQMQRLKDALLSARKLNEDA